MELQRQTAAAGDDAKKPLEWTGKLLGGLRQDIRRRARYYKSDWTDAFRQEHLQKTMSSVFFLFFACLSPAIAFGTLFDAGTNGAFGVVEMILSSAVSGVIYALLSGQPLCILGATGPILAYTVVLYNMCAALDLEFLPCYFWVGVWTALFTTLMAVTDTCCLMSHVTKFTEEIFSGLISLIFIVEAIKPIVKGFEEKGLEAALLQALLMVGTWRMATQLAAVRDSQLMNLKWRKFISNFGVSIAILSVSAFAKFWDHVDVDMLKVPATFRPSWEFAGTDKPRSWLVNPMGITKDLPVWAIFFAIIPALGFAVLGFLDQNLTTILVNRPQHKLAKPPAYHLDLAVCGTLVFPFCAVFGLPFPVAATVRSLTHLASLSEYQTVDVEGGGQRKVPVSVVEQRVTNLGIHVLIGLSLVCAPLLSHVPNAVLCGVFLYMGVGSLNGNELFERLALWLIWDPSKYPQYSFVKKVPLKKLHLFTVLQALCLAILYALKSIKAVAVVFPFFIAALVFIRKGFGGFFSVEELEALDGEESSEHETKPVDSDDVSRPEELCTGDASTALPATASSDMSLVEPSDDVEANATAHEATQERDRPVGKLTAASSPPHQLAIESEQRVEL